jgi:hypothetical protein
VSGGASGEEAAAAAEPASGVGPVDRPAVGAWAQVAWLWDARALAVASSLAVLAAATALVVLTGRDAVASPATAARAARVAALLVLPGVGMALVARSVTRPVRALVAAGGAATLVAAALWLRAQGGLALLPAAALLLLAALPSRHQLRAAAPAPARADLVVAGAVVGVLGVVGRAVTLDGVAGTAASRLNVAAAGLVLLAWPLLVPVLLPARFRDRALVAASAVLVAVVVARAPAGGEAWLVPGLVLVLLAALTRAADDEVGRGWF